MEPRAQLEHLLANMALAPTNVEQPTETAALLAEVVARGHRSAREFRVSDDVFLCHLAAVLHECDDLATALRGLHVEDLYLACACVQANDTAIAELERQFVSQIPLYLASLRQSDGFVADVSQLVREKLLVARGGDPGKLADYRGTGALGGWLRVVAVRAAKDLLRAAEPQPATRDSDRSELLADDPDPEVSYLKRRCAKQLEQAFNEILATLGAEERAMLSLTFLDGLSSGAIGKMYGVDGSTVRRRLQTLRENILHRTRELLAGTLGADTREIDSLIDFVRSRVDLDLSALLRAR